ncbi:hypothetical protein OF83DRAFT_77011 [Amylostereum chailletii]|nr:hypothetical protein OF83DRAFT_77011 [Amylostereum chailletii]
MRPAAKRAAFKRSLSQEALDQAPELMTVVVHDSLIDISEYSSTSKPASRKLSQTSTTTSVEKSPCDASPSSPTASKDTTVSALRLRRLTKSSRANVPALTLNPNAPVFTPKARNPFQTPTSSPASPNFPPTPTSALISDNSPRAIPTYVTSRPNRPANSPHVQVASPTSFNAQPVFIPVAKSLGAFVPVVVGRGAVGMVPVARRGELF